MGEACWGAIPFPVQNVKRNPATSKPDFDFNEVELLFDDSEVETIIGTGSLPLSYKEGSRIYTIIHWIQDAPGVVKWQLEVKAWNLGETLPAEWASMTTIKALSAYVSGEMDQYSVFPAIEGTTLKAHAMFKFKLSRLADDVEDTKVGDARYVQGDAHYQRDSWGSGDMLLKQE